MNSLQNKAVSALQIFVSKYLLLLFIMLLGVGNAQAQQNNNAQNRIIGYWKGDLQTVYNGFDMTIISYDAVFADGSAKSVALGIGNGNKTTLTSTYKYWFEGEGKYYCTQPTGKPEISKSTLEWVSNNEGYQTWVNGQSKGVKAHYVRVTKEEFEKYFNNSVLLLDINIDQSINNGTQNGTQGGFKDKIIGYWQYETKFTWRANPTQYFGDTQVKDSDTDVSLIGYRHITAEGWYQQIELFKSDKREEITNAKAKYWLEGGSFCTPGGKYPVNRCKLDFLTNDKLYAKYVSGLRVKNNSTCTERWVRVSKEEFEKYVQHPSWLHEKKFDSPTHDEEQVHGEKKPAPTQYDCPTCHGACTYTCHTCHGQGELERTVQEQVWDYYNKKYKYETKVIRESCSNSDCISGKVKCRDSRCSCNIIELRH